MKKLLLAMIVMAGCGHKEHIITTDRSHCNLVIPNDLCIVYNKYNKRYSVRSKEGTKFILDFRSAGKIMATYQIGDNIETYSDTCEAKAAIVKLCSSYISDIKYYEPIN